MVQSRREVEKLPASERRPRAGGPSSRWTGSAEAARATGLLAVQRKAGNAATTSLVRQLAAPVGQAPPLPLIQRTATEDARAACDHYRDRYATVFQPFDPIRLPAEDLEARFRELLVVAGGGILEDYTDEVLSNDDVLINLRSLAKKTASGAPRDVVGMVNDALLFASLIPAKEQRHRQKRTFGATSVFERRAVEVLSLDRLIGLLRDVSLAAGLKGDVFTDADSVRGIRYDKGEALAARMARLSLVNMREAARTQLQDDEFFQSLLASPALGDFLMASSGADEQVFLNTCAASAVNQQVLGQVTTIAGLLVVGRSVADRVAAQASGTGAGLDETETKHFTKKRTMRELATKRADESRREFQAIQDQAQEIATSGRHDVAALKALTRRWSRQMQKLAGVLDLSGGTGSVPVLSKKVVPEAWMASAVLSTLSIAVPADRTMRRKDPTDQGKLVTAVSDVVALPTTDTPNRKLKPSLTGGSADANVRTFWDKVFAAGGAMFSTSSHALYVKAIKRGGERIFAIGDPKGSRYAYKSLESFASYARSNDIDVPAAFVP